MDSDHYYGFNMATNPESFYQSLTANNIRTTSNRYLVNCYQRSDEFAAVYINTHRKLQYRSALSAGAIN